jgi:virginiamycin B lyase
MTASMTRALRVLLVIVLAALASVAGTVNASITPHLRSPTLIAAGPDGNLWVKDEIGILRVSTDGRMTRVAPIRDVGGITAGPDGAVWFTRYSSHRVGRIAPDGQISYVAKLDDTPGGIAAGGDGNLWVAEGGYADEAHIARVTPAGTVTEFSDGLGPDADPYDMIPGPDGDVWFADLGGRIGRITTDGAIAEYKVLPGKYSDSVQAIAAGPDGAVWFTVDGTIGRFAGPGDVQLYGTGGDVEYSPDIVAGADGNLWFTTYTAFDLETAKLGRITPEGDVRFFGKGLTGHDLEGIAAGPDGNLWATEHGRTGSHVVRMSTSGAGTEFPRRRPPCRVPRLARNTLPWVEHKLFRSLCTLDPASARAGRKRGTIVLKVSPLPGSVRPYGARVHVKFGHAPRPSRCELPYASHLVARSERVLVFSYEDYRGYPYGPTTRTCACLRPRGRPHEIGPISGPCCRSAQVPPVIAAGKYVAYVYAEFIDNGGDSTDLHLYDVAARKDLFSVTVEAHSGDGYTNIPGNPKFVDYAVSWRGALAWFAAEGPKTRLFVHLGHSTRRVDIGTLTHLRFRGDRLMWRKNGRERSARVR